MRLIPKKTKVNPTVWLNFTLFDMVLAILLFVGAFLIAMSNFEIKWGILLAYVSFSVMLFFPDDGERAYNELIYILRYFASRKKYEKGANYGCSACCGVMCDRVGRLRRGQNNGKI